MWQLKTAFSRFGDILGLFVHAKDGVNYLAAFPSTSSLCSVGNIASSCHALCAFRVSYELTFLTVLWQVALWPQYAGPVPAQSLVSINNQTFEILWKNEENDQSNLYCKKKPNQSITSALVDINTDRPSCEAVALKTCAFPFDLIWFVCCSNMYLLCYGCALLKYT